MAIASFTIQTFVGPKFKHFPHTNFCLPSQSSCLATLVKTLRSEMLNSSKIDFNYAREIKPFIDLS